jgi:hypothetical protein
MFGDRAGRGKDVMECAVRLDAKPDLLQVVDTLSTPRRFTRRLDGRQQKSRQDRDDHDNNEQLDQRKAVVRV